MIIEAYPNFIPLEIAHHEVFRQAFKNNPPKISEFTFTNLYSWREAYKIKVSVLGDFIILRSESEPQLRLFDPIGKGDKKKIIKSVLNYFKGSFIRIPEVWWSMNASILVQPFFITKRYFSRKWIHQELCEENI